LFFFVGLLYAANITTLLCGVITLARFDELIQQALNWLRNCSYDAAGASPAVSTRIRGVFHE
jgi:hypothetical protein